MSCVVVALTYLSNINFADHNHLYPQKNQGEILYCTQHCYYKKIKNKKNEIHPEI